MTWIWIPVGIYLLLLGTLFVFQRNLLYLPSNDRPDPARVGSPAPQTISVTAADGTETAHWYWPPASSGHPDRKSTRLNSSHPH